MEFKVGDRVEVLAPAEGVGNWDKNNIGYGTVERVSTDASGSVQIKVDANDCAWWYKLGKVRLVRPVNEPTPTPSITVGTQVRLTGVVKGPTHKETGAVGIAIDGCPGGFSNTVLVLPSRLEVIRQPFKRGEVVWATYDPKMAYQVLRDEKDGIVLIIRDAEIGGNTSFEGNSIDYERRP